MKFKIYKTSTKYEPSAIAPCKTAEPSISKDENGYKTIKWFVELKDIKDLIVLIEETGDCVISAKTEDEGFPEIEIYDDYRE